MDARAQILIGALLAIHPWPASCAPLSFECAMVRKSTRHARVCLEVPPATDFAYRLDPCSGLPGLSIPAFCAEETANDEEESPTTVTYLPRSGHFDCLLSSIASMFPSNTGIPFTSPHAPLRC